MKAFNLFYSLTLSFLVVFILSQYFTIDSMIWIWVIILLMSYSKSMNNFISMLLILEMLSLTNLLASSFYASVINISTVMFVVMTLSVGEAVLGLATLVKLVRWNSTEFLLGGLS